MSNLIMQSIGELLGSNNLLAEEGRIQSIWGDFRESFSYEQRDVGEDDDLLELILETIQTTIIDKLTLLNNTFDDVIDILFAILQDIKRRSIENELTSFLTALLVSLQNEVSVNKKICINTHINESNQKQIMSTIDRNDLLTILVAHGSVPVDELESFLDDRKSSLMALTRSIIVDTRQFGDSCESSSHGVTSRPLSLREFGTNLDRIIYWVTQFLVYNNDSLPDDLMDIKEAVFPINRFPKDALFQKGSFVINFMNYRVLCATLQYISDTTAMWVNDCIWVLVKKLTELSKIRKKIDYLMSIDLAYIVLSMLLLRILKVDGNPKDYRMVLARLTKVKLNQLNREITVKADMEFSLFGELWHTEQFQDLRSYINDYESEGISFEKGMSTLRGNKIPTIESIYTETSYLNKFLADGRLVGERTVSEYSDLVASSSHYMVEQAASEKRFVSLASTLRSVLNESLIAGDDNEVAIVLEAIRMLRMEFAPVWKVSKEGSEVSNALEKLGIYEYTYAGYEKHDDPAVIEKAGIMFSRVKKTIQD